MSEEPKLYWTDDDDLVAKYVLGQMTPEEKKRLEEEIADHAPGKAKLQEEMEIAAGIRRHGRDLMKAQLRTKLRRARGSQFSSYQYAGLAAAVVIVLIGIGAYQIWFSDLAAPKKFHEQEIVLAPTDDDAEEELPPEEQVPSDEPAPAEDQKEPLPEQPAADVPNSGGPSAAERFISSDAVAEGKSSQSSEKKGAAEPAMEKSVTQSPATTQSIKPAPAAALTDARERDVVEKRTSETMKPGSKSIWLIGRVVMISDMPEIAARAESGDDRRMKKERAAATDRPGGALAFQSVPVQRLAKDEGIVLQQRAIKDLPEGLRQRKDAREFTVQTLLERSDAGISLTLYGEGVSNEDLQEAVVERMTDDSLVVSLPHQRIAFKFPSGWNNQPARR